MLALGGGSQNGVPDLDVENVVSSDIAKFRLAISHIMFNANRNVWCFKNVLPISLKCVNDLIEFDLLTLKFGENAKVTKNVISLFVY